MAWTYKTLHNILLSVINLLPIPSNDIIISVICTMLPYLMVGIESKRIYGSTNVANYFIGASRNYLPGKLFFLTIGDSTCPTTLVVLSTIVNFGTLHILYVLR